MNFFNSNIYNFRYMIVKHAGNGLISHGSANLKLLKILYWVITLAFIAVAYGNMPLSKQLKPGFPENTVIGKICLKRDNCARLSISPLPSHIKGRVIIGRTIK